jgi:hypothetical protein
MEFMSNCGALELMGTRRKNDGDREESKELNALDCLVDFIVSLVNATELQFYGFLVNVILIIFIIIILFFRALQDNFCGEHMDVCRIVGAFVVQRVDAGVVGEVN